MKFATIDQVRVGTILRCDGDFTCMNAGEEKEVQKDADGNLWVPCECGRHGLEGQLDYDNFDTYVGFEFVR